MSVVCETVVVGEARVDVITVFFGEAVLLLEVVVGASAVLATAVNDAVFSETLVADSTVSVLWEVGKLVTGKVVGVRDDAAALVDVITAIVCDSSNVTAVFGVSAVVA